MNRTLINGNMLEELDKLDENSVDAVVTDPPYELNFMSKGWDNSGISFQKETWERVFRVLKPGGYLLAFGGSRTFHRIACAIEDAGFEIRDTIMWIYGSGFPKSMNIGIAIDKKLGVESAVGGVKSGHEDFVGRTTSGHMNYTFATGEFDRPWMHDKEKAEAYHYEKIPSSEIGNKFSGFGTALKPSYEPVIMARKPLIGTVVDNIIEYGVGGINIDECRIQHNEDVKTTNRKDRVGEVFSSESCGFDNTKNIMASADPKGRFPANLILTYDDTDYDEVCGGFPYSKGASSQNNYSNGHIYRGQSFNESSTSLGGYREWYNDEGSAARYFYCAKASKRDRNEGVDGKNIHATVKPTSLMQYLVRLVSPKGSVILDPFMGSGSTGKAVAYENNDRNADYSFIGIELQKEYFDIAEQRIIFAESDKSGMSEDKKNDHKYNTTKATKKLF